MLCGFLLYRLCCPLLSALNDSNLCCSGPQALQHSLIRQVGWPPAGMGSSQHSSWAGITEEGEQARRYRQGGAGSKGNRKQGSRGRDHAGYERQSSPRDKHAPGATWEAKSKASKVPVSACCVLNPRLRHWILRSCETAAQRGETEVVRQDHHHVSSELHPIPLMATIPSTPAAAAARSNPCTHAAWTELQTLVPLHARAPHRSPLSPAALLLAAAGLHAAAVPPPSPPACRHSQLPAAGKRLSHTLYVQLPSSYVCCS